MKRDGGSAFITVAAATLLLAGCGVGDVRPPEPQIKIVETKVPVDDPACVRAALAKLGPQPVYPDSPAAIQAAPDIEARTRLILAGRELRKQRSEALIAALQECSQ